MATRYFEYEGISMRPFRINDIATECGGVPMTFDILVNEVDNEGFTLDDDASFSVGTIEITRISDLVLYWTELSRDGAIDATVGTYEWGVFTVEAARGFWDRAFPECGGDMLDSIDDFIGIESIYIDPQFRSKGIVGQALKSMASVTGFGAGSMMVLMANPWNHPDREPGNPEDPEYQHDMAKLVSCYLKMGFREVSWVDRTVFMALSADYKNKAWERLWTENTSKTVKLRAFKNVERVMLHE